MSDTEHPRTVNVTLKLEGPMERRTFDPSEPYDHELGPIGDVIHWARSVIDQIDRLRYAINREWRHFNARPHKRRRYFSDTTFQEHTLVVAAAQLEEAIGTLRKEWRRSLAISADTQRALRLLRNIYEHWPSAKQQLRTNQLQRATAKLRVQFPQAAPWTLVVDVDGDDVLLAKVVSLRALRADARIVLGRTLRLERQVLKARQAATK